MSAAVAPCARRAIISSGPDRATPQGCKRKAQDAEHEYALGTVDVTEPAPDDNQCCITDQIDGDDRLNLSSTGAQIDRYGRKGDIDDKRVDHEHELRCDDGGEHPPALRGVRRADRGLIERDGVIL